MKQIKINNYTFLATVHKYKSHVLSMGLDLTLPDGEDWAGSHYVLDINLVKWRFCFEVFKFNDTL